MVKWMRIILFALSIAISDGESEVELGDGVCFISQVGGGFILGNAMFLEDCDTLEEFETIPHPAEDMFNHLGVHPVVCCPQPIPDDYEEDEDYNSDYYGGGEYGGDGYEYLQNEEYEYYGPSSTDVENIDEV